MWTRFDVVGSRGSSTIRIRGTRVTLCDLCFRGPGPCLCKGKGCWVYALLILKHNMDPNGLWPLLALLGPSTRLRFKGASERVGGWGLPSSDLATDRGVATGAVNVGSSGCFGQTLPGCLHVVQQQ